MLASRGVGCLRRHMLVLSFMLMSSPSIGTRRFPLRDIRLAFADKSRFSAAPRVLVAAERIRHCFLCRLDAQDIHKVNMSASGFFLAHVAMFV